MPSSGRRGPSDLHASPDPTALVEPAAFVHPMAQDGALKAASVLTSRAAAEDPPSLGDPGEVFAALADGTRRAVLREVATRGEATATEVAAGLPVSRQAVVKHLGVLAGAGLVAARKEGREQRYRPTPAPLADAIAWMTEVGSRWDERLTRLARAAGAQGAGGEQEGRR